MIEDKLAFTDRDLQPAAKAPTDLVWHRNVRNALQDHLGVEVERGERKWYRLTSPPRAEEAQDVRDVYARCDIDATEKESLVKARRGQGEFRRLLLKRWKFRCAVTRSQTLDVIRASHIKRWRESTDQQRLDPENGLPLVATLDALFETGLITFDSSGKMIVSSVLSVAERCLLGARVGRLTRKPTARTADYLAWHRKHRFKK
jgi:hypothetical protein